MFESEFESRWSRYRGLKDGKKLAKGYWNASVKTEKDLEDYDTAEQNYYNCLANEHKDGFKRRFKFGKTWFNNWRDYLDIYPSKGKGDGASEPIDPEDEAVLKLFTDFEDGKPVQDEARKMLESGVCLHNRTTLLYILENDGY